MRAAWLFFLSQAPAKCAPFRYGAHEDCLQSRFPVRCFSTSSHARPGWLCWSSVRTVRHKTARQRPGRDADGCSP